MQQTVRNADLVALAVAGGMAFLAGATDVCGLARLHDLFVSFMSGNTTMLGVALGRGDFIRAGKIGALIALFVVGAAAGTAIAELCGSRRAAAVACAVAVTLSVPLAEPDWATPAFAVAMGALNAAMNRAGGTNVGLTYVTGALVKFGQGLVLWLSGRGEGWAWALQGAMWLSLLAGAIAAVLVQQWLGAETLWPLPALAFGLAAATAVHGRAGSRRGCGEDPRSRL